MRRRSWRVVAQTFGACLRYRVTGLAAEAAFFAILSLPPLVFGLAGAVGFVAQRFEVTTVAEFRSQVLAITSRLLVPSAVEEVIAPTLDEVLSGGRFDIISIGFVIALWSGSRSLDVVGDTATIMYGLAGKRSILRTRALSFSLYTVFLISAVVLLAGAGWAGCEQPDAALAVAAARSRVLAGGAPGLSGAAGHPLPPGRPGADPVAQRLARCRSHTADVAGRQCLAAPGARPVDRHYVHLRTAGRADRGARLAVP